MYNRSVNLSKFYWQSLKGREEYADPCNPKFNYFSLKLGPRPLFSLARTVINFNLIIYSFIYLFSERIARIPSTTDALLK